MNITLAVIRPSFVLRLSRSRAGLTMDSLIIRRSPRRSARADFFLIFSRRDREKRSRYGRDPYLHAVPAYVPRG